MKHAEYDLQKKLVALLREHGVAVFAVRNERNEGLADARLSNALGRTKGAPDLIAGKGGKSYWLELKADNGKQSLEQKCFEALATTFGAKYIVVKSIEDIKELL